jgi:hypothetical protein
MAEFRSVEIRRLAMPTRSSSLYNAVRCGRIWSYAGKLILAVIAMAPIATGGAYETKTAAEDGCEAVQRAANGAQIVETDA